ncbi:MAG: hypothetical protein V1703_04090 [Candidatus Altiarchaeota archaeon]
MPDVLPTDQQNSGEANSLKFVIMECSPEDWVRIKAEVRRHIKPTPKMTEAQLSKRISVMDDLRNRVEKPTGERIARANLRMDIGRKMLANREVRRVVAEVHHKLKEIEEIDTATARHVLRHATPNQREAILGFVAGKNPDNTGKNRDILGTWFASELGDRRTLTTLCERYPEFKPKSMESWIDALTRTLVHRPLASQQIREVWEGIGSPEPEYKPPVRCETPMRGRTVLQPEISGRRVRWALQNLPEEGWDVVVECVPRIIQLDGSGGGNVNRFRDLAEAYFRRPWVGSAAEYKKRLAVEFGFRSGESVDTILDHIVEFIRGDKNAMRSVKKFLDANLEQHLRHTAARRCGKSIAVAEAVENPDSESKTEQPTVKPKVLEPLQKPLEYEVVNPPEPPNSKPVELSERPVRVSDAVQTIVEARRGSKPQLSLIVQGVLRPDLPNMLEAKTQENSRANPKVVVGRTLEEILAARERLSSRQPEEQSRTSGSSSITPRKPRRMHPTEEWTEVFRDDEE